MPSPIFFFIFIIVIDLVLKSAKDKQKIEKEKQKGAQQLENQPSRPRPMVDLKKMLEVEVEKERQREMTRRQERVDKKQDIRPKTKEVKDRVDRQLKTNSWDIISDERNTSEVANPVVNQVEKTEGDFKKDILRGIIFSEILSEPKSIQNQRRSP